MKDKDIGRLREQVKAAWNKLPVEVQAQLNAKMGVARLHASAAQTAPLSALAARPPRRELMMLDRVLHGDAAAPAPGAAPLEGLLTYVAPDGEVYFGDVDYDSTDPGWAYCLVAMVDTDGSTPPFQVGKAIQIPDNTTLAILGDWGGANQPALAVGAAASSSQYIVHLGDVYYAGTNGSLLLDPYEPDHFLNVWPGVAGRSFALNSNHDMYAHATGYSLTTLAAPQFQTQGGNCFALYNNAYRIVGLDTAYYAPDNGITDFPGYMIGSLGDPQGAQAQFLLDQIGQLTAGQKLILLTHHNGLNLDGSVPAQTDEPNLLWQQITAALQRIPAGASKNVLWYWGHVHAGAVYSWQTVNGITIYPRCCGHGCIPWGVSTELQESGNVLWFENQVLPGGGDNYFVTNGYATLALNGTSLTEAFFNQNGVQSWSQPGP